MTPVAITQRVAVIPEYGERRDCLDQAWPRFLHACGLSPLPIPNVLYVALEMFRRPDLAGLVLTGGNDLVAVGGNAPERDRTENALVDEAESRGLPVLAVCRGMQLIQHRHGIALSRLEGHVTPRQTIAIRGRKTEVNSYHCFGARDSRPPFEVWAVAADGVVKAIRHESRPITGIMWHPERNSPFAADDLSLFRSAFGAV
jgi:N5-(cytidine 5'-diphosphoramidyl)-L-glutamine hydrolase